MQWDRSDNAGFTTTTPWLPVNTNYRAGVNVEDQSGDDVISHLSVYKQLTSLRHSVNMRDWSRTFLFSTQQVFSVLRQVPDLDLIVVINVQQQPQRVNLEQLLSNIYSNQTSAQILIHSSGQDHVEHPVGAVVDVHQLDLAGFESLVMKLL